MIVRVLNMEYLSEEIRTVLREVASKADLVIT